jgi:hypothetical protein
MNSQCMNSAFDEKSVLLPSAGSGGAVAGCVFWFQISSFMTNMLYSNVINPAWQTCKSVLCFLNRGFFTITFSFRSGISGFCSGILSFRSSLFSFCSGILSFRCGLFSFRCRNSGFCCGILMYRSGFHGYRLTFRGNSISFQGYLPGFHGCSSVNTGYRIRAPSFSRLN